MYKGCQKCPDHGFCDESGRLESCEKSYEIKGQYCVKDEQVEIAAHQLLLDVQDSLKIIHGQDVITGQKVSSTTIDEIINITHDSFQSRGFDKNSKLDLENVKQEMLSRLLQDYR